MPYNFEIFDQKASREVKLRVLEQNDKTLKNLEIEINNPSVGVIITTPKKEQKVQNMDVALNSQKNIVFVSKEFISFFERLLTISIDDDFREKLYALLNPSDFHFNNFIAMSKIKIYENIVLLSNMSYEDGDIDVNETLDYVHNLQNLIAALDEVMEEKELAEESGNHQNDLFFLQAGDKIPFVESTLKDIPPEYYERIIGVLEDLHHGYFGNFKYLVYTKFFEIRSDLVRVFFARIGPNKLLVLDTILKKKKSSTEYWDRMYALRDALAEVKPYYSEIANKEEEKQRHLNYYLDTIKMLNSKKRGG